jgi:hypothetical protein
VPRLAALLLAVAFGLAGCIGAMQTQATDPVGAGGLVPTVEDKDVGLVGLRQGFDLKTYTVLAVDKLPVSPGVINDAEDRKFAAAMPTYFQSETVRRIREVNLFAKVVNLSETSFTPGPEKALKLQGKITQLDPGSRALRYVVGFGAGRSKAQAELYFVDAQSGEVVMVIADRRVAAYGIFGGDSEEHLQESFGDMARDLARFLTRLSKGEPPAKETQAPQTRPLRR